MNLEILHSRLINYYRTDSRQRYDDLLISNIKRNLEKLGHSVNIEYNYIYERGETVKLGDSVRKNIKTFHPLFSHIDKEILNADHFFIFNKETDNFIIVDLQDGSAPTEYIHSHPNCLASICSFYDQDEQQRLFKKFHKIVPGYFFPKNPILTENSYEIVKEIKPFDKRMFFAGTIGYENGYVKRDGNPRREIALVLKEKYPDHVKILDRYEKLPTVEWFKEASKHYINLTLPGHPWCSRDFELLCLGLPILASEWKNPMITNLIPNYHYMSAAGGNREYTGVCIDVEYAADRLFERYKKSIDNPEYLQWVGNNGRQFYLNYIKIEKASEKYVELILNLFESNLNQ